MSDRAEVLGRVRRAVAGRVAHPGRFAAPDLPGDWETFAARLRSVGGEPWGPVPSNVLRETLLRLARAWAPAGRVVVAPALVERAGPLPFETLDPEGRPEALADVELCVLPGAIGVAENGAVALEGRAGRPRAAAFLCQRLALVLDCAALVPDLHRAFDAMPRDALRHHHYTWISGPSKTADIEQTLVLGAHGPRQLAVIGTRTTD